MDKNAVFGYVEYAREELQKLVRQKAFEYGITEKGAEAALNGVIKGRVLSKAEVNERDDLISNIHANEDGKGFANGFDIVMEEAAYTWFNRFIALRFMEVNGYLPSHTRVFSDEVGKFNPQIIKEALTVDIYNIDRIKVADMVQNNRNDELFKYLIILQCNELSKPMPKMFERIANYTELLFPNGLLKKGSIIDRLVSDIAEEDWKEQVQIIGWMYQFYISKKKDEVFASKKTITKNTIGAVTQLFTPDWIVRYMVENSIGRIWLESYPNSSIKSEMKYYVEDAEQEDDVKVKIEEIRYKDVNPEDIKIIEPCCGSGHIMVYCFDLLYSMYIEKGYSKRDIPTLILKNNLYGLDVDKRASQLAYFSVMMKARSYDRQYLKWDDGIPQQPHVYEIIDSQAIIQYDYEGLMKDHHFTPKSIGTAKYLVSTFKDGKVIGSLLKVNKYDYKSLVDEINDKIRTDVPNIMEQEAWNIVLVDLKKLVTLATVLSRKYDVLITNPPYLGSTSLEPQCKEYAVKNYPNSKSDMFAMFMETNLVKDNGLLAMINMQSWMFLSSFEKFRNEHFKQKTFINIMHLGPHAFETIGGEIVQTVAFVERNCHISDFISNIIRLVEFDCFEKEANITNINNHYYVNFKKFSKIPGYPCAYWINNDLLDVFNTSNYIYDQSISPSQNVTGNNEKYLRYFWELNRNNVADKDKWIFYAKGGGYRKWYGNLIDVIDWSPAARNHYATGHACQIIKEEYWYKKGITWCLICTDKPSFRVMPSGATFDKGGSSILINEKYYNYVLGLLNSKIAYEIVKIFNPTIHYQVRDIRNIPFVVSEDFDEISKLSSECVEIAKEDWDSFETSWEFQKHPLISGTTKLSEAYSDWETKCNNNFCSMKAKEENINRLFIKAYKLDSLMDDKVLDSTISCRLAEKVRDIKSLISYAIGVSFGRYSLNTNGLIYAGGEWNPDLYSCITPDSNAIIPILDDGYYTDDAMNKLIDFISKVYGQDTLDENLKFIADALGGNGTSKEVIRNYLLSGFYSDHLKTYQKRPIYWLFDAGKQNSFKALIYMHRYTPDLLAKMRTDYILPLMDKYSSRIEFLEREIPTLTGVQATKSRKELEKVKAQLKEISEYEPKIHHLADERISIDLDDGVKHNYELFKDVLAALK